MLNLFGSRPQGRMCDHLSRRDFFRVGALGVGGLTLADLLRLQAQGAAKKTSSPKAVIMVYLAGGPSHIDMYDMKPNAPREIRGEFNPIPTNVPGFDICELMPLQAKIADKLAIVRGLQLSVGHEGSLVFSGFRRPGRPVVGSVVSRVRAGSGSSMPPYVSLRGNNGKSAASFANDPEDPAYLGPAHRPFVPTGLDNLELVRGITMERLSERQALLRSFDTLRRDLDTRGELTAMDAFNAKALRMITSTQVRDALDVRREPDHIRNLYGDSGASLLLARRLVEAGVSMVTLTALMAPPSDRKMYRDDWDTHQQNFPLLRWKLPRLDQAIFALVTDLHERGLDKDVAVVVWGEMGRTPRVNAMGGRDHWGSAAFVLFAGGGMRPGQVVGATDRHGEKAEGRPFTSQNVLATLYHVLGIDPGLTFLDHAGRPQYLVDDREKIAELL